MKKISLSHKNIWKGVTGKVTTIAGVLIPFAVPYITGQTDWETITLGTIVGLLAALTGVKQAVK